MALNSIKLEATVLCPKTNKQIKYCGKTCHDCTYYEGSYCGGTTECWFGTEVFDLALLRLVWNNDEDRKQLPVRCRPFEAPSCRCCDKFATDDCYARIKRNRRVK